MSHMRQSFKKRYAMEKMISALFLFENTDYNKLDSKYKISENTVIKEYGAGDEILSGSTPEKGIFILLCGTAVIYSGTALHKTVLRHLKSGDSFGAASLFDGADIYNTSVISGEGCTAALLAKALVTEIVKGESDVAFNYLKYLSGRVSFLNKKIAAFTAGTAEQKLAVYLTGLGFTSGAHRLEVSYTSLASMLGIGRASLYRALELFEKEGVIKREGKTIFLSDDNLLLKYI